MKTIQHVRLGALVLAATLLLVVGLYMVGQQRNMFGKNTTLFALFHDVDGLMPGNNVRFNGYSLGRVLHIEPFNDSLVKVVFSVDNEWLKFISINAQASLSTDGLLGNKILEIEPGSPYARAIAEGDTLHVRRQPDVDMAMRTLNETNNNLLAVSEDLKSIAGRLSADNTLWQMLSDTSLSPLLQSAVVNLEVTSARSARITGDLRDLVSNIKDGKGSVGAILTDTSLFASIQHTVVRVESISDTLAMVSGNFKVLTDYLVKGKGNVATFISDTLFVDHLNAAVQEFRGAAATANETMQLLKQSRILKRYYRRREKG